VRQRVPPTFTTLLIVVPWVAALVSGGLSPDDTPVTVSMRDSYLLNDNIFPLSLRENVIYNDTLLGKSTRDDPNYAESWNVLYEKFDELPCKARPGRAVGEVWIAPGDACFLARNSTESYIGNKMKESSICDDETFRRDFTRNSHFLVCMELTEYDLLRNEGICYNDENIRHTDNLLRSVCFGPWSCWIDRCCPIFEWAGSRCR
jgi:hypothetical protein